MLSSEAVVCVSASWAYKAIAVGATSLVLADKPSDWHAERLVGPGDGHPKKVVDIRRHVVEVKPSPKRLEIRFWPPDSSNPGIVR